MVLAPIDPVAPSNVTLRDACAGDACMRAFGAAAIISSPYEQSLCGGLRSGTEHTEYRADERGGKETVEPIHQAAVTGDQMACILGTKPALDGGFGDVSGLGHRREQQRHDGQVEQVVETCATRNREPRSHCGN